MGRIVGGGCVVRVVCCVWRVTAGVSGRRSAEAGRAFVSACRLEIIARANVELCFQILFLSS